MACRVSKILCFLLSQVLGRLILQLSPIIWQLLVLVYGIFSAHTLLDVLDNPFIVVTRDPGRNQRGNPGVGLPRRILYISDDRTRHWPRHLDDKDRMTRKQTFWRRERRIIIFGNPRCQPAGAAMWQPTICKSPLMAADAQPDGGPGGTTRTTDTTGRYVV